MKQYKLLSLLAGVSLMAFTSCDLEEMPTTSIGLDNNEEAVVNGVNVQQFENGLYSSFRATQYGVYSLVPELICDGFNESIGSGNNYGSVHRTDASFTASDQDVESIWAGYYSAITNYNIFINDEYVKEQEAELEKLMQGDNEANPDAYAIRALGVAHFFRAYTYMQLARLFAKDYDPSTAATDLCVPLVLEYNQEEKPARATVQAVYDQIKKDLEASELNLEAVDITGQVRSEAVTLDAVYALYARYYLDTHDYPMAAHYARTVVDSKRYVLASNEEEMQQEYTYDEGKEPIFQMAASLAENGSGTNDAYTQAGPVPDGYEAFFPKGYYLAPYYLPSFKVISLYGDNDIRLNQWFAMDHGLLLGGHPPVGPAAGLAVPVFTKYLGNPALNSSIVPNARQHVKPFMIGEMYLILAEAALQANDPTTAAQALNKLQTMRGATPTAATMENIQNEWFKETIGEGLRFSCLKRWGTGYSGRKAYIDDLVLSGADNTKKVMPADDDHWLLPIPTYERQLNDNLEQNPGY